MSSFVVGFFLHTQTVPAIINRYNVYFDAYQLPLCGMFITDERMVFYAFVINGLLSK